MAEMDLVDVQLENEQTRIWMQLREEWINPILPDIIIVNRKRQLLGY